uniref:Uncharacterized protein n=1 Tax=Acanthochromis polyacanthus TaxID=80966 RepID=A0A3Q1FBM6_9TELE
MKTKDSFFREEPHNRYEAWKCKCSGLGLLYCLKVWTACCHLFCITIRVFKDNVIPLVQKLKLRWSFQQNNDPKHANKSTKKRTPTETLCGDLQLAMKTRKPSNTLKVKKFSMEAWSKFSANVISAKGSNTYF